MDEMMNRSRARGFAEAMVVMICPVLLALALNMVDLNVDCGRVVPIAMLVFAGVTLISGICPFLAYCFSEMFPDANLMPAPVTKILAPISSACLLVPTCWMSQIIVPKPIIVFVGVVVAVAFIVARTVCYHRAENDGQRAAPADENTERHRKQVRNRILDESHEFLCAVTGILFLGLEGLALEGHNQMMKGRFALGHGAPMGILSFVVCFSALGVVFMFLVMIPPLNYVAEHKMVMIFTFILDCIMATCTVGVLLHIMVKLMGHVALMLVAPPVVTIGQIAYQIAVSNAPILRQVNQPPQGNQQERKPAASLELTKVTFTGFLAVSVTAIGSDSPSRLTGWFLLFAAAAIVCGLSWRLLSQAPDAVASSASNLAAFCAHLCIVVATVLFVIMAGIAGAAKESHAGNGNDTRVPHVISSAQIFAPTHVITGCTSVILFFC